MNLSKHLEFFNPMQVDKTCHIIGLGAIGSTLCENLARLGISKFKLYDFDKVTAHNIANQMFNDEDIHKSKIECVENMIRKINPLAEISKSPDGWQEGMRLNGYVFLCVDNIELRHKIAEQNYHNSHIVAMFDFRMRLEDAQHYSADWSDIKSKDSFIESMNFTHAEAVEQTPVSACGTTLSVLPTVRMIVACGVSNFINFIKGRERYNIIAIDAFSFKIVAI